MTFSELVFELARREHPLCRATQDGQVRVVYRCVDTGELASRHRAHLTIHADERRATELVRDLRSSGDSVEILHQAPSVTSAAADLPVGGDDALGALAHLPTWLARDGIEGALDPILATGGRLRVRIVAPRAVDEADAIRVLPYLQKNGRFDEARLVAVAALEPSQHVTGGHASLAPDQEDILAIAAAMGYYEAPKEATLSVIARRLGRSVSPVHKRLKAAEETLVALHVGAHAPEARPRARGVPVVDGQTAPWEVVLRVPRADLGPARLVAQEPGTRAQMHALSQTRDASAWMLTTLADRATQAKLSADLASRRDVSTSRVIGQGPAHVAHALVARERGAFHLPWWSEVWGDDAHLRSVSLEGDAACLRILLARPHTQGRLDARVADAARLAGWGSVETIAARALGTRTPPEPPSPLTPRQVEVLRVAHALGYYRTPRACTLERVASTLGVSANAIHKNLVLAESKIIAAYLSSAL